MSAGISDWLSYYGENGIDGWMPIPAMFGGSAYDDPDRNARSSASNFTHNEKTPTFAYVPVSATSNARRRKLKYSWHAMKAMAVPTCCG